jgi:hypothetical protein
MRYWDGYSSGPKAWSARWVPIAIEIGKSQLPTTVITAIFEDWRARSTGGPVAPLLAVTMRNQHEASVTPHPVLDTN